MALKRHKMDSLSLSSAVQNLPSSNSIWLNRSSLHSNEGHKSIRCCVGHLIQGLCRKGTVVRIPWIPAQKPSKFPFLLFAEDTGLRVWLLPYQPNVVASRVSLDFPEDCARDLFGIPYWFDPFRTRPRDEDKWIPFGLDINFQWSRCIQMSCVCGYANFATNLPRD